MTPPRTAASTLVLHPADNVAVAIAPLAAGEVVPTAGGGVTLLDAIPPGHKVAVSAIDEGASIVKYGQPMGQATRAIRAGEWVHTHNVRTTISGVQEYRYAPAWEMVPPLDDGMTFDAFVREDGAAGIRNELWVLPTVGCVNDLAQAIARRFRACGTVPHVDGVHVFTHPFGCSQLGDDLRATQQILAGLARHPNAAGVLVIGLGCENNHLASFRTVLGPAPGGRYRFLAAQEAGDEIADGVRCLEELARRAAEARRRPVPVSRLRVGLKCGGSDGLSGITANRLVGRFSDELIRRGGATVLTEVPEMFGAEALFMNRCVTPGVFEACASMVNGFKEYFIRHGQPVYENPSPGNKEGGITTLEEKSLGCLQKGGTAPIVDVLPYGGRLSRAGMSLLSGPGNDLVSVTALAAAGTQLVLFTTGRGTPLGGPVPTLKISSNSALAERKPHWIDYDAGPLARGADAAGAARDLLGVVLDVASGRRLARNETNDCREMAIFKDGVTL
jgi:altronate hydrolase